MSYTVMVMVVWMSIVVWVVSITVVVTQTMMTVPSVVVWPIVGGVVVRIVVRMIVAVVIPSPRVIVVWIADVVGGAPARTACRWLLYVLLCGVHWNTCIVETVQSLCVRVVVSFLYENGVCIELITSDGWILDINSIIAEADILLLLALDDHGLIGFLLLLGLFLGFQLGSCLCSCCGAGLLLFSRLLGVGS